MGSKKFLLLLLSISVVGLSTTYADGCKENLKKCVEGCEVKFKNNTEAVKGCLNSCRLKYKVCITEEKTESFYKKEVEPRFEKFKNWVKGFLEGLKFWD